MFAVAVPVFVALSLGIAVPPCLGARCQSSSFVNIVPVVRRRAAEVSSGGLYLHRFLVSFAAQRASLRPSLRSVRLLPSVHSTHVALSLLITMFPLRCDLPPQNHINLTSNLQT